MNPRILGAFLVGAGLIALAYFYAPQNNQDLDDASLAVVAGPAPVRSPIAIEDRDNDGVPDWKEEFRHTEPIRLDNTEEAAEVYTPPETLTGSLALELFEGTMLRNTPSALGRSQEELLRHASVEIARAGEDDLFLLSDIEIDSDTTLEDLRVYGNRVAGIILLNGVPVGTRSELEIVEHALRADDPSVLAELDVRIEVYETMVQEMLETPTPSVVAREHLNLTNSLNALLQDLKGMREAFEDPLNTMVRLKRYYDDAIGQHNAIAALYEELYDRGARFEEGDLTLSLVLFIE